MRRISIPLPTRACERRCAACGRKLAAYYETEGRLNRFRIAIEDGQYTPRLTRVDALPVATGSHSSVPLPSEKLSVLVLPVLPIGFRDERDVCDGLTLNLMRAMAASGQARVVPWTTAHWLAEKTGDKHEQYLRTNADVILEPLAQQVSQDRWNITVQAIDGPTGLFDRFYEAAGDSGDVLPIIDELAGGLAESLRITYDERTRSQLALRHTHDRAALTYYLKARRDALIFTPPAVRRAFELLGQALSATRISPPRMRCRRSCTWRSGTPARLPPLPMPSSHARQEAGPCSLRRNWAMRWRRAGAIELTHDWDLRRAGETLRLACSDPLAEALRTGLPFWICRSETRKKRRSGSRNGLGWTRPRGPKAGIAANSGITPGNLTSPYDGG